MLDVSTNLFTTCALIQLPGGNQVKCFGKDGIGERGSYFGSTWLPSADTSFAMGDALPYIDVGPGRSVSRLAGSSSGDHHCLVLDGSIRCFSLYSSLGTGDPVRAGSPVTPSASTNAAAGLERDQIWKLAKVNYGPKLHVPPADLAAWSCVLNDLQNACGGRVLRLSSRGTASVDWRLAYDAERVRANVTSGTLAPGEALSVALTVDETSLASGVNSLPVKLLTTESGHMCFPGSLDESTVGFSCLYATVGLTVSVDGDSDAWSWLASGMVVSPRTQGVEVRLDNTVPVTASVILTDLDADNTVPYTTAVTGGTACTAAVSVSSGASGQLRRMQRQAIAVDISGVATALDYSGGTPRNCAVEIRRTDSSKVDEIKLNVVGRRGPPSSKSLVEARDPWSYLTGRGRYGSPVTLTFKTRDRLDLPCDSEWEGTRFSAVASQDGTDYALPGTSQRGVWTNDHTLTVLSLQLTPGSYVLSGLLFLPNQTTGVALDATADLTVSPLLCPNSGEDANAEGTACACSAGYTRVGEFCLACPLHQYKATVSNAGCTGCPPGATTTSTGSTSAGDCTCQANSQLNAAGDTC